MNNYKSTFNYDDAVKCLSKEDGKFHNSIARVAALAVKAGAPLDPAQTGNLVQLSKELSPKQEPSAWLEEYSTQWKNVGRNVEAPDLGASQFETRAAALTHMDVLQKKTISAKQQSLMDNVIAGDYSDGKMPEFVATSLEQGSRGAEGVRDWVAGYAGQSQGAVTLVLEVAPAEALMLSPDSSERQDATQYLGIAYDPEDITTSHVLQALKQKGYAIDEQSEAQLEAFQPFAEKELPISMVVQANQLAKLIPNPSEAVSVHGLEQLSLQSHPYDVEALAAAQPKRDNEPER
jgi:hypothetical protein